MDGVSTLGRDSLTLVAYGTPAPQGSKRHVGNGVMIESSPGVKVWREDVKLAALRALEDHPGWYRDAQRLSLSVVFSFAHPRKHFRGGKSAHLLRDDAPIFHATTPDLDKLIRSTGDALATAGVYADDKRVVQIVATKTYTADPARFPGSLDRPGARITVTNLTPWETA